MSKANLRKVSGVQLRQGQTGGIKAKLGCFGCEQVNNLFSCKSMYIDFDKVWAWHSSHISLYSDPWIGHAFMPMCIKSTVLFLTSLILLFMYSTANNLLIPFLRETDLSIGYYGFKPQNASVFTRKIWSGVFFLLLFWVFYLGGSFYFFPVEPSFITSDITDRHFACQSQKIKYTVSVCQCAFTKGQYGKLYQCLRCPF